MQRNFLICLTSVVTLGMLASDPAVAIDPSLSIEQLQHTSWTVREGAPINVSMMAQTDDGFLWFATTKGLVRFDGLQFMHDVLADGRALPKSPIRSLLSLPDNGLMVGWFFGGASIIRNGRVTDYGEKDGYPPGTTYGFVRDRRGHIWAATSSALARFDGKRWQSIGREWNFEGKRALAIFLDRDGMLGVFTNESLMTLADGATAFQPTGGTTTTRVPIVQAPSGALYISDLNGVRPISSLAAYERLDAPWTVTDSRPHSFRAVVADRHGALWVQSESGIRRIRYPETNNPQIESFSKVAESPSELEFSVFEDREGSIWFETRNGINRLREGPFHATVHGLAAATPAMIPDASGGIWFAGFANNLNHLSRNGTVRQVAAMAVSCAYLDRDGNGWFGTRPPDTSQAAELWRLESGRTHPIAMPPDILAGFDMQAVALDGGGGLWISIVRDGIYRRIKERWERPKELLDEGKQSAIVIEPDARGGMWFGYVDNQLVHWIDGVARTYSSADGLDVGNVLAIAETGGKLWVGGQRGLAVFHAGRFQTLKTTEPNVFHGIKGIVETRTGDLWLHAVEGAIRVRRKEVERAIAESQFPMAYRLFDYDDGLIGSVTPVRPLPTLIEGADGRLWFGTTRGPIVVDPARIRDNEIPPSVIINAARAGTTTYQAPELLQLPALTTNLEFDYTTTSLAAARRVQFRYRLSGVDQGWQEAGARRQAYYTNLNPGSYRFQVIAANEDGVWNLEGASVDITIAPAWYQSWWFYASCGLAIVAAFVAFFRARLHRMRVQVQGRLQERLLERERIARELHDTLIQSFQGLVLTLAAAVRRVPEHESARSQLEKALVRANSALAEGRDRVRDLRTPMSLHSNLPAALQEAADDLGLIYPSVTFELKVQGTSRTLHPLVIDEAYRIGHEALVNAYTHGQAANIGVEIDYGARHLRLHVRDDGKGIDADVLAHGGVPGHWGMTGMRERAQRLGARLMVRSGAGSGSEVELDIPAAVAYREPSAWWRRLFPGFGSRDSRHGE